MIRKAGIILLAVGAANAAFAQGAGTSDLVAGRQNFEQSCGVRHTKPLITSGRFGPALSKASPGVI
jgi:mono/diheme cytochrome c family protein